MDSEDRTLGQRLIDAGEQCGDRTFCRFVSPEDVQEISYRQLLDRSLGYAQTYRELGVGAGDVVFVILRHTPHLFYAFLGAVLAGAIPSFMPYPTPKQRPEIYWDDHRKLFERVGPRAIVTYAENARDALQRMPQFAGCFLTAGDGHARRRAGDDAL